MNQNKNLPDPEQQKDLVKKLREDTDKAILDCKKALIKADWDMDEAKEILKTLKPRMFI